MQGDGAVLGTLRFEAEVGGHRRDRPLQGGPQLGGGGLAKRSGVVRQDLRLGEADTGPIVDPERADPLHQLLVLTEELGGQRVVVPPLRLQGNPKDPGQVADE
jgi:hypothetical protein